MTITIEGNSSKKDKIELFSASFFSLIVSYLTFVHPNNYPKFEYGIFEELFFFGFLALVPFSLISTIIVFGSKNGISNLFSLKNYFLLRIIYLTISISGIFLFLSEFLFSRKALLEGVVLVVFPFVSFLGTLFIYILVQQFTSLFTKIIPQTIRISFFFTVSAILLFIMLFLI